MPTLRTEEMSLCSEQEIVLMRQAVRKWAVELKFSLVDQTKIVTAASELGRNTLVYGGGGKMTMESLEQDGRKGLRLAFRDEGPGIADLALALKDGYTSGTGLGLGLGGAKRLVNEFSIRSAPGEGTEVTITKWK